MHPHLSVYPHEWEVLHPGQPSTSGVKEGVISLRSQKGPKRVDTNNVGVKSCWFFNNTWENLLKGMEFRPEHFITNVFGKYPRLWALKGAGPNDVRRWYNFGVLALIRTVAPGFQEILELPDWVLNAVDITQEWKSSHHHLELCGKIKDGGPSTKKKKATYRTHLKSRRHEEK
ncbi:hypothetical protein ACS0TY_008523 [Phlomoides rotata]